MKILQNINLPYNASHDDAVKKALELLKLPPDTNAYVYRQSIDARRKSSIKQVFSVAFDDEISNDKLTNINEYKFNPKKINKTVRPLIVGMGPAGLFCAYMLSVYGLNPIIIERGEKIEDRRKSVDRFWNGGEIDENSNVQFGEGGAGAFSDGKLVTRINDPRTRKVLEIFADFGAPKDILYKARPHIGTDRLVSTIINIRNEILKNGGEIYYNTALTGIEINKGCLSRVYINSIPYECSLMVLCTGNSARDVYKILSDKNVACEPKPFSVGVRIEHLRKDIDFAMYGDKYKFLPAADYNFSHHIDNENSVYTFCMCPGGFVINSSSDKGGLVTNGMSMYARDGVNSNSALLTNIRFSGVSEGIEFQKQLEKAAYNACGGLAPVMTVKSFLEGISCTKINNIKPSFLPGYEISDFSKIFPQRIINNLQKGLAVFGKKIHHDDNAVLTAAETRTSAPIRILRNPVNYESVNTKGLYPCGEGAGYAGGITSSAVDGIKIAQVITER